MKQYLAWQRLDGENGHRVCRRLLEELYATHVGEKMPNILIKPGGKPFFEDEKWHFSISHSKNHGFCVLCDRPVGIDAEERDRPVSPLLAEKILSPMEKARYETAADKNRALLTFWVLKESAGKLSGRGIGLRPNHTNFMLSDRRVQEIDSCLVAVMTQEEE